MRSTNYRTSRGASLALVVALLGFASVILAVFALSYVRELGSYQEQRTAVDASALAAAKDLSRIIVEDPNVGFVGLSCSPPTGSATAATDGYATEVHGINDLLATARLDLILAGYMQDPVMQAMAQQDYNNAIAARALLVNKLNSVINNSLSATDINGQSFNPLQDAIDAYNQNSIHMQGRSANLVPGSLKLTLGYELNSLSSQVLIPKPSAAAQVAADQQENGYYLPDKQISLNNQNPVVFAALVPETNLVSINNFKTDLGVTNSIPTVIRVDTQEIYHDNDNTQHTVQASAAAEASCIIDPRPNPGALTLTFQNGPVSAVTSLGSIFTNSQLATDPTDLLQSPINGDYPETPLSPFAINTLPNQSTIHPQFTYLVSVAFYDWLRRAGPNVDIGQLMNILNTPLTASGNSPQTHWFQVQPDGSINYQVRPTGLTNLCVSQNQWCAVSGLGLDQALTAVASNNPADYKYYDVEIDDFVFKPGRSNGGKHAGEPLSFPGVLKNNPQAVNYVGQTLLENTTWPYQSFLTNSSSGFARPTYSSEGIACNITFRQRQLPN